jgi:ABC-type transporter Mla subunit MlaD
VALQDLTPQLRTRLSRVERVVGLFVAVAVFLFIAGFVYYLYHTAQRKGWFLVKVPYYTYVRSAEGLNVGDPVKLMGFDVGEITAIETTPPEYWYTVNQYNVFVQFQIRDPYYGYIWTDSRMKVTTGDFLGGRQLEVTKGSTGMVTVIDEKPDQPIQFLDDSSTETNYSYVRLQSDSKGYWLRSEESTALTERFEQIATQIENALPAVLSLTNQLAGVLDGSSQLTSNLNTFVSETRPAVRNLTRITRHLKDPDGSLGRWLLTTNLNQQLELTLNQVDSSLSNLDTNLTLVSQNIGGSLTQLANLTSNLNAQVEANTNILSDVSTLVVHLNELAQGLKQHWFLRSAFKNRDANRDRKPLKPFPSKGGGLRLRKKEQNN